MAFEFPTLEPHIRDILQAPSTNLNAISAKGVRRELSQRIPTLTPEFLKTNKKQVDEITERVFAQVKREREREGSDEREVDEDEYENTTPSEMSTSRKRKEESSDGEDVEEENDEDESPPPKKAKKAGKGSHELSDAVLARQLSSEINRSRRSTTGKRRGATNGTPKKRSRKSAATVDSGGEEDVGEKPKKKARGGLAKEYLLSEPLSALTGQEKLSRPQVVKALWDHIKGNGLQNPDKRQEIICDASFKAVFGVEKIDMFKMNKVLGQHLHEPDE
ncbi:SWIB-domain-containing protein [Pluteus cervinus]|uniref:SWIB-domain-containing protein n=1 Tax=Pluteus cervinus TaxID=181527 RepID=A0ACD3BAI9_9AGAR|nr:SWIB-domain-containing protein [Pluteus cervinus]